MQQKVNSLPGEFIKRIKDIYPGDYNQVLQSMQQRKKPVFRGNLSKISRNLLKSELKKANIEYKQVDWYKNAFILVNPSQREFQDTGLYKQGLVYLQNLSSMVPVIVLEPDPADKILDLCAAPGSKTMQIVDEAGGNPELLAVEKVRRRLYKLLANLRRQGKEPFVEVRLFDGTRVWRQYPQYFDKILIDAPCSVEAGFLVSNFKTFRYWSLRKIKESRRKQKRLLFSGIKSLQKGGRLVYSTCTFAPEENEAVVNWALKKFSDEVELERIKLPFNNHKPGLAGWRNKKFLQDIAFTKRIMPTETMEGFFIAAFRKKNL